MVKNATKHLRVRSRNYSNAELKNIEVPVTTIYRMGSTTPTHEITKRKKYIEINTAEACAISASKIEMKKRFVHGKIRTPKFFMCNCKISFIDKCKHYLNKWNNGIIAKRYNSSKGNGLFLIKTIDDAHAFIRNKDNNEIKKWIFERYSTYTREYRLHVTKNGCFYACRKMLRNEADVRWHRHDNNSVWITENNEKFDKPANWNLIVDECIKALKSIGLDIAAFDIKVQRSHGNEPKYLILECNSAPGLGQIGLEKYKEELSKLIKNIYESN